MSVLLETTLGDIVVDLYTSERKRSCMNFLKLCKIKYYNYCLFFSVQRNYVAQTGDPSGTGRHGESVYQNIYGDQARYFEMELKPKIKHTKRGSISFVNNGNNQHGSQFFLTLASNLDYLDGKHTVFGEVSEGFDILDKINEAICDDDDRPYQDIRVNHTIILDDPFDDPAGLEIPDRSPEPTKEQLKSSRIGADEKIDEYEGKRLEEIQEIIEEKDLKIGTQILQTIGDIPDADLKPPENVLFICKLNPVTAAEDLEIIFSRFGKTLSCEIIRDHKTGDSLCYGFIEFEKVEDCEKAYFKMDNVLIDDRRIHVDFCQSINSQKWNKSGLRGKYAFSGKKGRTDAQQQIEAKPKPKKFEVRNIPRRDKYEMVFDEEQSSSGPEENSRKPKKKEKEKHRKRNKSESDSDDGRIRKRKIDKSRERRRSVSRERERNAEQRKHRKIEDENERKDNRREKLDSDRRDKRPDNHKRRYHSSDSEEQTRRHEHRRKDEYKRRAHDISERREHDGIKRRDMEIELKRKPGIHKFEIAEDKYDRHSKHKSKKSKKEKKKRRKSYSSSSSS